MANAIVDLIRSVAPTIATALGDDLGPAGLRRNRHQSGAFLTQFRHLSPGGETGRHKGLKIPRRVIPSCRFDPCPGHHRSSMNSKLNVQFRNISLHSQ